MLVVCDCQFLGQGIMPDLERTAQEAMKAAGAPHKMPREEYYTHSHLADIADLLFQVFVLWIQLEGGEA